MFQRLGQFRFLGPVRLLEQGRQRDGFAAGRRQRLALGRGQQFRLPVLVRCVRLPVQPVAETG
ncbi:hypothetical protein RZS08_54120, partial [Arthrospira platensis SPKY1]|nr:hypothetical protein [Arthrospira platensis SPKY1]